MTRTTECVYAEHNKSARIRTPHIGDPTVTVASRSGDMRPTGAKASTACERTSITAVPAERLGCVHDPTTDTKVACTATPVAGC